MEQDSKGQAKGALMKSLDNALTLLEQFTPEASAWVGRVFAESGLPGRKIAADRKNIFYTVPAAEVQRRQAASEGVVAEWVKDVTAKGYDGKKLLEEAKALMK